MASPSDDPTNQPESTFSPLFIIAVALLVVAATNQNTRPLLSILGLILIVNLVHLGGFVIAGLLSGASIEKIDIFTGPKLAVVHFRGVPLSVGCLPTGGSVAFKGMAYSEEEAEGKSFRRLPLAWRMVIIASGPLAVSLLASVCIGPVEAGRSLINGFHQFVMGAFAPSSQGQALLKKALYLFHTQPFVIVLGVVSAKIAAGNLLPVPPMNGGQLLMELFRGRIEKSNTASRCQMLGLTFVLLLFLGWCIAVCDFALASLRGS